MTEHDNLRQRIHWLYSALDRHFAPEPHWWPIHTSTPQLEVILGSVLVQQTRWETVEAAVLRLRAADLLDLGALAAADPAMLAQLIRPCAFQSQKAAGIRAIAAYLIERHNGDIAAFLGQERTALRSELLALPRVGRETADSIMLYGGGHPVFIVDAYARRLFARLDLIAGLDAERAGYDQIQARIEAAVVIDEDAIQSHDFLLPPAISAAQAPLCDFYRHFHALIIEECIHHCLANRPRCERSGLRRRFVDPRKCAEHCNDCGACPLSASCPSRQAL